MTAAVDEITFGIRADAEHLDREPVPEPGLSRTGKTLVTFNKCGFDVQEAQSTWVINDLLSSLQPGQALLDVGAGFGGTTRSALSRGLTVIMNDADWNHLLVGRQKTSRDLLGRLFLLPGSVPHLDLPCSSVDAVLAHRVLHFLSGSDVAATLNKVAQWLRPGGLLGVAVMSASHGKFRDQFLPSYHARRRAGQTWPGEWLDVPTYLADQSYGLPARLHVFEPDDLATVVSSAGFEVLRCDYLSLDRVGAASGAGGREHVGIIARRKEAE